MVWILIVALVALDQITKYAVHASLAMGQVVPLIPKLLQLRHVHNNGAAFSILQGKQWFFTVISLVAIIILLYLLLKTPKGKKWWRLAFCCFLAGTVGNFIDRLRFGYVEDFLDIHILPVFNIADMLLVGSVIGICLLILIDDWLKSKGSVKQ